MIQVTRLTGHLLAAPRRIAILVGLSALSATANAATLTYQQLTGRSETDVIAYVAGGAFGDAAGNVGFTDLNAYTESFDAFLQKFAPPGTTDGIVTVSGGASIDYRLAPTSTALAPFAFFVMGDASMFGQVIQEGSFGAGGTTELMFDFSVDVPTPFQFYASVEAGGDADDLADTAQVTLTDPDGVDVLSLLAIGNALESTVTGILQPGGSYHFLARSRASGTQTGPGDAYATADFQASLILTENIGNVPLPGSWLFMATAGAALAGRLVRRGRLARRIPRPRHSDSPAP